jgi:hypothetical protein
MAPLTLPHAGGISLRTCAEKQMQFGNKL